MLLKLSSGEGKVFWTIHSKMKMRQYRFSKKRVLKIFRKPDRKEYGIAPGTIAVMQKTGTKKHPTEAWMMYVVLLKPPHQSKHGTGQAPKESKHPTGQAKGIKVISAWRYPGITPVGERPIIPEDTLEEIEKIIKG